MELIQRLKDELKAKSHFNG